MKSRPALICLHVSFTFCPEQQVLSAVSLARPIPVATVKNGPQWHKPRNISGMARPQAPVELFVPERERREGQAGGGAQHRPD